ncbi:Maf family nucleotide pyrophosphatase [Geobacter argillaceus]|uniref:dTTP/UTP pyrophosphatase n=1 Tax=Geobacter argillaceus TaxID=345631 RepID=A0A562V7R3_9BACT|nr:Maf family nucleotide pyrophosphatase [Geobacter argillaceus]TWJ13921.1 septum formation protein [Geobacter argillaceus]
MATEIVLASASPRRAELLESAGIRFVVVPGHIDETPFPNELPAAHVLRLAGEKARDVAGRETGRFFIGADTVVVCDGEIMGKPRDDGDAVRMLRKLSGVAHEVITGFAVLDRGQGTAVSRAVTTRVFFKPLADAEIAAYVETGCPLDKAGAYAIQGGAAYMVERIDGSYTNVVGLPLCEVVGALRTLGAV